MRLTRPIHVGFSIAIALALPLQAATPISSGVSFIRSNHAESIYQHILENHWVPKTGLFLSFPDSTDRKLSQQASLYEQGAMGLLALRFGDVERAQQLYSTLKEEWFAGPLKPGPRFGLHGLPNFLNGEFGNAGIEKTIHVGPNAWIGLFAARLANVTKDPEVMQWAMDIAYWIQNGIPHENGGVAMGQKDDPAGGPWAHVYSTENNLSYYGFLTELLRSPRLEVSQRQEITRERDHVENWLIHSVLNTTNYHVARGINPQGPDNKQAVDTVTWMISAIGPKHMAARGIDPVRLMKVAEKTFEVQVSGRLGVDPADQAEADFVYLHDSAKPGQVGRPATDHHRLIWYEGVGQYVLALSQLAEYAQERGNQPLSLAYLEKAKRLTQELDSASLKNFPSGSAYGYATPGRFFRDGWRAPAEGESGPASSLISSIWRCFAGLGTDPLAGIDVSSVQHAKVSVPQQIQFAQRKTPVLYGTSEDMVVQAWKASESGKPDQAIEQATATIQEWSSWALQLQQKKQHEVGRPIDYSGEPQEKRAIFSYWALNDVGAAYFILGKAYDEKHDYSNAVRAFQQLVNHYSLAQVWDPKGWFWSPTEAVSNDFVQRDPQHYGEVIPQELAGAGGFVGKQPN